MKITVLISLCLLCSVALFGAKSHKTGSSDVSISTSMSHAAPKLTMEQIQAMISKSSTSTPKGMQMMPPQQPMGQGKPASNMPIEKRVKINVNKLNSTAQLNEQTFGKNQLIKMGKDALPYLHVHIQNDKRTWVRAQIAQVLGSIGDTSSIPVLEKTAKSKYLALNKNCVRALGAIGNAKAIEALDRLKKESSEKKLISSINDAIKKAKTKPKAKKKK